MACTCRRKVITGQLENSTRTSYCDTRALQSSLATMASTAVVPAPHCTSIDPRSCRRNPSPYTPNWRAQHCTNCKLTMPQRSPSWLQKGGSVCSTQASAASCSWL
ncbi:hypothetical protein TRVL_07541 [Trypanosoma vivax]|nr:hypothetical protein TRVL_07541 [Trypanosoma vivax]